VRPCVVRIQLTDDDIRRDCEAKGVPVMEHPGTSYYLCGCGKFHLSPGYEQYRSPLGWTTRKTLGASDG
jgi:hypothetical protein